MDTIPCPGCTTPLEPSATGCPICLRGRSSLEITRAYATLREMKKQRQQRPFIIAGYVLAASAAGWALYRYHRPLAAAAVAGRARLGRFVDEALSSALPAPPPDAAPPPPPPDATSEAPAPSPFAAQRPPPPSAPASFAIGAARSAPAKTGGRAAPVEDLPLPAFDSSVQWVFYGRVYDLITLLPVSDVQLSFTVARSGQGGNGGSMGFGGGPRSDAEGRFSAVLGRLAEGSYEIHASRSGYASAVLYESDIPYAKLPLAERREMVANAQDGDMTLPPLTDVAGEESIRRDIFLAPHAK